MRAQIDQHFLFNSLSVGAEERIAIVDEVSLAERFLAIEQDIERLARVELYAKDSRVAILRDGTKLPLSRAGYARLSQP